MSLTDFQNRLDRLTPTQPKSYAHAVHAPHINTPSWEGQYEPLQASTRKPKNDTFMQTLPWIGIAMFGVYLCMLLKSQHSTLAEQFGSTNTLLLAGLCATMSLIGIFKAILIKHRKH